MSWEFIEDRDEETKAGVWNPTLRKCTHFAGQGKELEKVVKEQESMDEGERATWFPLVTWEVMIKYKHKTYLFPWVSVRLIFMNVVSLQNVSQHDEVMLRRKTWLKLFFMTLSYATVSICCSNQGNMLLRSPREPLWGTDWLTVPPVTSGSTTALEQFPGMCQSVTSTVWARLHTFSAQHSMLGSFAWPGGKFHRTALLSEALSTLSLRPVPFVCIKPPLTHCAWVHCAKGISPKTSVGICFLGPKLMQYIRHNQSLIDSLSSSDNPDSSEARANLPEKFIWN